MNSSKAKEPFCNSTRRLIGKSIKRTSIEIHSEFENRKSDKNKKRMEKQWKNAEELLAKIKRGDITATQLQVQRLEALLEGNQAQMEANFELRKGLIGLMYERKVYQSKLGLIEKLGVSNKWNHPLLIEIKEILYSENETFQLTDFLSTNE